MLPGEIAFTTPYLSTVATLGLELVQKTFLLEASEGVKATANCLELETDKEI